MHQMWFGGRAPPGHTEGVYSTPPDPLAALKLLAPWALHPGRLASRLRRSEMERSGSSFFPFQHYVHCVPKNAHILIF